MSGIELLKNWFDAAMLFMNHKFVLFDITFTFQQLLVYGILLFLFLYFCFRLFK